MGGGSEVVSERGEDLFFREMRGFSKIQNQLFFS
jgi:hypothetical protein